MQYAGLSNVKSGYLNDSNFSIVTEKGNIYNKCVENFTKNLIVIDFLSN